MPDDVTTDELEDEVVEVVHDDIVKRLLDYQRQLRDGALVEGEVPPETVTIPEASADDEVIDLTDAVLDAETSAGAPATFGAAGPHADAGSEERATALEGRIAAMEGALEELSSRFAELRSSFQDMAIAADERLAAIDDLLAETRAARR